MADLRLLVTGGNGFIGSAFLSRCASARNWELRGTVRRSGTELPECVESVTIGDLTAPAGWKQALAGVDVVVHTAARVHNMKDTAADPAIAFRTVNVLGTLALGRAAAAAGVKRFVFLSSIKVNGDSTELGRPYRSTDAPAPAGAYAISKLEAEFGLQEISRLTGMEVVVLRPVLVYGPGVRANFLTMMRWLHRGIPLPLGSIVNARSLIGIDNLVDLMETCVIHPGAANATLLVSDGEDLSTPELLRRLGAALGRKALLFPLPQGVLNYALRLAGKSELAVRICASLQVDLSVTQRLLGWRPPVSVDRELAKTAAYFLRAQHANART